MYVYTYMANKADNARAASLLLLIWELEQAASDWPALCLICDEKNIFFRH